MILCGMLLLGVLQPAQGAIDFVLGVLADAARVEQDRVGFGRRGDEFVALLAQTGHDQLAVEHVHLAADGFDIQTWHWDILVKMVNAPAAGPSRSIRPAGLGSSCAG